MNSCTSFFLVLLFFTVHFYFISAHRETLDLSSSIVRNDGRPPDESATINLKDPADISDGGAVDLFLTWLAASNLLKFNFSDLFSNTAQEMQNIMFSENYSITNLKFCENFRWAWIYTILASIIIALTGVAPALFLPFDAGRVLKNRGNARKLNCLLSFAVGSLLGNIFLHILPESWRYASIGRDDTRRLGLWVIFGSILCFLVEKCASGTEDKKHKAAAFVNLFANAVDNFTHGLAVGGSFLISMKFGILTTFAILIHEIPHEISDFAILLRADFNRRSAVKAQLLTACGGIIGAMLALLTENVEGLERRAACWILPFTAGGFLNVALVQVLPDILKENSPKESAKQIAYMMGGVILMGLINNMHL